MPLVSGPYCEVCMEPVVWVTVKGDYNPRGTFVHQAPRDHNVVRVSYKKARSR